MAYRTDRRSRRHGQALVDKVRHLQSSVAPLEGGTLMERLAQCHCGSLRATTSGEPLLVNMCHCKACQRRTGALAGNGAAFAKEQVTVEGASKVFERDGQSGRKVRFYFCPACGTSVYWEPEVRPDIRIVAVGAFADPDFPPPSSSIFEATKHAWTLLPERMKHFQGTMIASS